MKLTSHGGFLKWGGTPKSSIFLWDFAKPIILGSTPILGNINLMAHLLGSWWFKHHLPLPFITICIIYPLVNTHNNYRKSLFWIGKSIISMGHLYHGDLLNIQISRGFRGHFPRTMTKTQPRNARGSWAPRRCCHALAIHSPRGVWPGRDLVRKCQGVVLGMHWEYNIICIRTHI